MVLIVGAGPVGLSMAIELARQGVPFRIIDKKKEVSKESRAAGVHARTLEALERMGVVDRFLEEGIELKGVNIFSHGKQLLHADLSKIHSPYPFVLGISQERTEKLLAERLKELGIEVEWGTEFTELGNDDFVIGCDGAHSAVREAIGMDFAGGDYHQHFIWCDVDFSWPLPKNEVAAFLDEHAGMFVAPINQEGRARLVFPFFDETHYSPDKPPTIDDVQRLVSHFGPEGMKISEPEYLNHFYVHHRIVSQYRKGNVFLVGDSAHIHSPVGGQGMNTGIQDACNLAWKLAMVLKGQAGEALLDSYQAERHPIGLGVVKGVDMATRLLTLTNPVSQTIRDRLLSFLGRLDFVQSHLLADLSETSVHYPKSPIIDEQGTYFSGGPKAGDPAPNPPSHKHQILLFAGLETRSDLRDKYHAAKRRYGDFADVHYYSAEDEEMHETYGALDQTLYLIRPDGYVGYRSQPVDFDWLEEYVESKLLCKWTTT